MTGASKPFLCMRRVALVMVLLTLYLGGCSGSGQEPLVPVSGKVMLDKKPLTRGSVSFRADKARGNNSTVEPYGSIEPDGTYTLYTNKRKGAPVGKYIVLVTASEDIDPANPSAAPKPIVHPKYSDPDRPILQVDVVENPRPGQYDLTVHE